jgi:2-hydroxy-6-oxonona-2,4-dienedioate hydrolase
MGLEAVTIRGLLLGDLLLGEGFRMIAPSRFGYLESPMPEDSSLEAQAEAIACLLDTLEIDRVTVATFGPRQGCEGS